MLSKKEQDLIEKVVSGGGATGQSMTADATGSVAQAPGNSKKQGDSMPKSQNPAGTGIEETDPESNVKPTGDMSAQNRSSVSMKEEIKGLFLGQDLSEEFKEKATTIFEAAVHAKVEELREQLEQEYEVKLQEQVVSAVEEISTSVDDYMNYVVTEWMSENEVAIHSSLRSEVTEEFINGMKTLFEQHYIDIPEDKVDVVEELSAKVEALEDKLNESLNSNIELNKILIDYTKEDIFAEVSEGLVAIQADKFKTLAEGVEFTNAETYRRKLEIVKENYFSGKIVKSNMIEEEVDNAEDSEVAAPKASGQVSRYVSAISRTIKK